MDQIHCNSRLAYPSVCKGGLLLKVHTKTKIVFFLQLKVFDSIIPPTRRTREMERLIAGMECKKVLFVDDAEEINAPLCQATGNLHYANVIPAKVKDLSSF